MGWKRRKLKFLAIKAPFRMFSFTLISRLSDALPLVTILCSVFVPVRHTDMFRFHVSLNRWPKGARTFAPYYVSKSGTNSGIALSYPVRIRKKRLVSTSDVSDLCGGTNAKTIYESGSFTQKLCNQSCPAELFLLEFRKGKIKKSGRTFILNLSRSFRNSYNSPLTFLMRRLMIASQMATPAQKTKTPKTQKGENM